MDHYKDELIYYGIPYAETDEETQEEHESHQSTISDQQMEETEDDLQQYDSLPTVFMLGEGRYNQSINTPDTSLHHLEREYEKSETASSPECYFDAPEDPLPHSINKEEIPCYPSNQEEDVIHPIKSNMCKIVASTDVSYGTETSAAAPTSNDVLREEINTQGSVLHNDSDTEDAVRSNHQAYFDGLQHSLPSSNSGSDTADAEFGLYVDMRNRYRNKDEGITWGLNVFPQSDFSWSEKPTLRRIKPKGQNIARQSRPRQSTPGTNGIDPRHKIDDLLPIKHHRISRMFTKHNTSSIGIKDTSGGQSSDLLYLANTNHITGYNIRDPTHAERMYTVIPSQERKKAGIDLSIDNIPNYHYPSRSRSTENLANSSINLMNEEENQIVKYKGFLNSLGLYTLDKSSPFYGINMKNLIQKMAKTSHALFIKLLCLLPNQEEALYRGYSFFDDDNTEFWRAVQQWENEIRTTMPNIPLQLFKDEAFELYWNARVSAIVERRNVRKVTSERALVYSYYNTRRNRDRGVKTFR